VRGASRHGHDRRDHRVRDPFRPRRSERVRRLLAVAAHGRSRDPELSNIPIRNDVQIDQRQEWDANAIRNALGPAGVQWDTTKAIVLYRVQDCNSGYLHQDTVPTVPQSTAALGTGVSVTIAPSASGIVTGYFQGGMLATTSKQTDASGQGGFVDVPEGSVTLTAKVVATGQTIGTAHVYARAGSVTDTVLAPSP